MLWLNTWLPECDLDPLWETPLFRQQGALEGGPRTACSFQRACSKPGTRVHSAASAPRGPVWVSKGRHQIKFLKWFLKIDPHVSSSRIHSSPEPEAPKGSVRGWREKQDETHARGDRWSYRGRAFWDTLPHGRTTRAWHWGEDAGHKRINSAYCASMGPWRGHANRDTEEEWRLPGAARSGHWGIHV